MPRDTPPFGFADVEASSEMPIGALRRLLEGHRPWRKVTYIAPEAGVSPESAWRAIKRVRWALWKPLALRRWEGGEFGLCAVPELIRALYTIDRAAGDDLLHPRSFGAGASPLRRRLSALFSQGSLVPDRLRAETVMGEAAESSIMEGASATRAQALQMLRTGRSPATLGERMILNNYEAMRFVKRSLGVPLSPELLLELQSIVTGGTLASPADSGRFRTLADEVRIVDTRDGSIVFTPPSADLLPAALRELCAFANAVPPDEAFLHPIVRSCILHFMVGYLHPFVDGNGRTARAVFYWSALRHGYSIFEYLAISEVIRAGYARYARAYADTERDDGDLTYFVLYHLDAVEQSLERLVRHLESEEARIRRSERLLALSRGMNLRQRLILEHAVRHPDRAYTVKSHSVSNQITRVTARTDLDGLRRRRLLTTYKVGREVHYTLAPGVADRLRRLGG